MRRARIAKDGQAGVALLVALATAVLVSTAATLLARAAATIELRRDLDRAEEIADDLLASCEGPLLAWLERSRGILLPPDADEPRLPVLQREWTAAGLPHHLTITAWDQEGLVPLAWSRRAPWSGTLPGAVRKAVRDSRGREGDSPGLDLWEDPESLPSPFPTASSRDSSALGSHVSMHPFSRPRINVCTAPMERVRAALRAAGRGGEEVVEAARERGELPALASPPPEAQVLEGVAELTNQSAAFSFRIDVRVGRLTRSWWWTYVKEGASKWRCVQRLGIST